MSEDWTWTCADAAGNPVEFPDLDVPFASQAEAEAWLGESWMDLAGAGGDTVTLLCDGAVVYGPMSLRRE